MQYQDQLEQHVKDMFKSECTGHDIHHLRRVGSIARRLQKEEGGDPLVIDTAVLLHDIHRLMERETDTYCPPVDSFPTIRSLLEAVAFPTDKIEHVLQCIAVHEEYTFSQSGKTSTDIEALILQDADNLDAMGAIGVARTFAFGGAYGIPLWIPDLPFDRHQYDEAVRDPSVLHHIHSKLLKLRDTMHTETAKKIAEDRHVFIEQFVMRFLNEWNANT